MTRQTSNKETGSIVENKQIECRIVEIGGVRGKIPPNPPFSKGETVRGFALLSVLCFIVAISFLTLQSLQYPVLAQQYYNGWQHSWRLQQAAREALWQAQGTLQQLTEQDIPSSSTCMKAPCVMRQQSVSYWLGRKDAWWRDAQAPEIYEVIVDAPDVARYVIEYMQPLPLHHEQVWRVTAFAGGIKGIGSILIQQTWAIGQQNSTPMRALAGRQIR